LLTPVTRPASVTEATPGLSDRQPDVTAWVAPPASVAMAEACLDSPIRTTDGSVTVIDVTLEDDGDGALGEPDSQASIRHANATAEIARMTRE